MTAQLLRMEQPNYSSVPLYIIPMYDSYSHMPPAPSVPQASREPLVEPAADNNSNDDETNVYYTGMDPNATKDYVIGIFNKFGTVSDCKILIDRSVNRCRGAGLVRFATRAQAEAAIEGLSGTVLPNSYNGTAMQLRFADTPDQKVERRHRNRKTRGGHFDSLPVRGRFDPLGPHPPNRAPSPSAASPQSIALDSSHDVNDPRPYFAPYGIPYTLAPIMGPSLPSPSLSADGIPQYTLYVTNLPPSSDEALLYQIFAVYGAILSIKIVRTISGLCKGYAFVNFLRFEDAVNALMVVNGTMVDEKPLIVTFASPTK